MAFLNHCPHLASLVLHNVLGVEAAVKTIKEIKNLRYDKFRRFHTQPEIEKNSFSPQAFGYQSQ